MPHAVPAAPSQSGLKPQPPAHPAVDPAPGAGPDPLNDLFDDPFEDVDS